MECWVPKINARQPVLGTQSLNIATCIHNIYLFHLLTVLSAYNVGDIFQPATFGHAI